MIHFEEVLGVGALGPIYRVRDEQNNKYICKKSIHPSPIRNIPPHPNVIRLVTQIELSKERLLFFQDMDGVDLEQIHKRYSLAGLCIPLLVQLCSGIAHLHRHGIIHRDIKPSNLIVTKEGTLVIIDLERGISSLIHHSQAIGHRPFLAPEVINRGEYSIQSDIFALASIIHELSHKDPILRSKRKLLHLVKEALHPEPQKRPSLSSIRVELNDNNINIESWAKIHIPTLCAERRLFFHSVPLPKPKPMRIVSLNTPPVIVQPSSWIQRLIIFGLFLIIALLVQTIRTAPQQSSIHIPIERKESIQTKDTSNTPTSKTITPPPPKPPVKIRKQVRPKQEIPLVKANKRYRFSSRPWGAEVWIDNTYIGTTLIQDIDVSIGSHEVKVVYNNIVYRDSLSFDQTHTGYLWDRKTNQWKRLYGQ